MQESRAKPTNRRTLLPQRSTASLVCSSTRCNSAAFSIFAALLTPSSASAASSAACICPHATRSSGLASSAKSFGNYALAKPTGTSLVAILAGPLRLGLFSLALVRKRQPLFYRKAHILLYGGIQTLDLGTCDNV